MEYLIHFTKTFIGIAIMLSMTLPIHMGFVISLFVIFLIPITIYSLIVMYKDKTQRKIRGTKLFFWLVAVTISISYNFYIHTTTRAEANNIVTMIENYKSSYGVFPNEIKQVGITEEKLRSKLGGASYFSNKGSVHLTYSMTYIIFESYNYDFEHRKWKTYN